MTRLKFRLHEVGTIVGGMLILPATPEVIAGWLAEALAAPEELSAIGNVMTAPPLPFLPPEAHGRRVVMGADGLRRRRRGRDARGRPVPRARATPIADMMRPMGYPEIYPPEDEDYRPLAVGRTMFVKGVDRAKAETIVERIEASTAMMAVTQLRVLGGAMARVPADATAFAHRQSPIMANVAAIYQNPSEAAEHARGSKGWRPSCATATTARTSASSPTRARSASARPTRARRGTGSPPSRPPTTPTTSSANQNITAGKGTARAGATRPA